MSVNIIDIVVLLVLLYAFWRGWSGGILMQLSGIGGIVLGVWASYEFGDLICGWFSLDGGYRFLVIVALIVGAVLCVTVGSRLVTGLFSRAGISLPLSLLGAGFSVVKVSFLLALVVMFLEWLLTLKLFAGVDLAYLHGAVCYEPLRSVGDLVFPYLSEVGHWTRQMI